ncbi:MAG: ribosome maturation factor RimM [Steroidobacteraceae bacterium]
MSSEWVELGRLGRPKGLKGWMHVDSWTDPPQALTNFPTWHLLAPNGSRESVEVVESRLAPRGLEARFEGAASREAVERWVGWRVQVPRSQLPALAPGEHYRADLLGWRVVNLEGVPLGVIERFEDFPAHPVMVVRGDEERWLPVTGQHLQRIDPATRCVTVDWPADF